jgi:hypothetical protein
LRGCIGTLEARQPLAQDVQEHAIAAALNDPRFAPVSPAELDEIEIEVSCLTPQNNCITPAPKTCSPNCAPASTASPCATHRAAGPPSCRRSGGNCPIKTNFSATCARKWAHRPTPGAAQRLTVQTYQVEEFHE